MGDDERTSRMSYFNSESILYLVRFISAVFLFSSIGAWYFSNRPGFSETANSITIAGLAFFPLISSMVFVEWWRECVSSSTPEGKIDKGRQFWGYPRSHKIFRNHVLFILACIGVIWILPETSVIQKIALSCYPALGLLILYGHRHISRSKPYSV